MKSQNKNELIIENAALKNQIRQLKDASLAVLPLDHEWTPAEAIDIFLESIKFDAETGYNGNYRPVDQTLFQRRVYLEAIIDKTYYFINGKGPSAKQGGSRGKESEQRAETNEAKRLYGNTSPQFTEAMTNLKPKSKLLRLLENLDTKIRERHDEINNKSQAYMAYGEQRQGNAPTNTSPKNRTLTPAEIAEYQELGITIDLDQPANAIAQREHLEIEESIQETLAAAANC